MTVWGVSKHYLPNLLLWFAVMRRRLLCHTYVERFGYRNECRHNRFRKHQNTSPTPTPPRSVVKRRILARSTDEVVRHAFAGRHDDVVATGEGFHLSFCGHGFGVGFACASFGNLNSPRDLLRCVAAILGRKGREQQPTAEREIRVACVE